MGSLFRSRTKNQTTTEQTTGSSTTTPTLPDWIEGPLKNYISTVQGLASQPFQAYTDSRVAGLTPDEQAAFSMIRGGLGAYQPALDTSLGVMGEVGRRGLQGYTMDELEPFMNPYRESVLDIARGRALDTYSGQQADLRARAGEAAAFGGSRFGIQEQLMRDNFQRQLAEMETLGLADTFQHGLAAAERGTAAAGQAALGGAQMAAQGQQMGLTDTASLEAIGQTQRGIDQMGLDARYEEFMREQMHPLMQAELLGNTLLSAGGLMRGQTGTSTQTHTTTKPVDRGSTFGRIVGGLASVGSLFAAPATGGTSLMGGLGDALGSLGGLFRGSASPLQGVAAAGVRKAQPGMMGNMMAGFSALTRREGGIINAVGRNNVKEYREGGSVYKDSGNLSNYIGQMSRPSVLNRTRRHFQPITGPSGEDIIPNWQRPFHWTGQKVGGMRDAYIRGMESLSRAPFEYSLPEDMTVAEMEEFTRQNPDAADQIVRLAEQQEKDLERKRRRNQMHLKASGVDLDAIEKAFPEPVRKDIEGAAEGLPKDLGDLLQAGIYQNLRLALEEDPNAMRKQLEEILPKTALPEPKEDTSFMGGINLPLLAFGATLLEGRGDFWSDLGTASKAFAAAEQDRRAQHTTKEDAIRQRALESAKLEMDRQKTLGYLEQTMKQGGNTPIGRVKQYIDMVGAMALAEQRAGAGTKGGAEKAVHNRAIQILNQGGQAITNMTPEQHAAAYQQARQAAMRELGLAGGLPTGFQPK